MAIWQGMMLGDEYLQTSIFENGLLFKLYGTTIHVGEHVTELTKIHLHNYVSLPKYHEAVIEDMRLCYFPR